MSRSAEVIIVGSGPAGVAAACTAADNGANVTLVEAYPFPGGELASGFSVDGCLNARGQWLVGSLLLRQGGKCVSIAADDDK